MQVQSSPLTTLEHEQFYSNQFGEAPMSDSLRSDDSVTDPQAHGQISGRLRANVAGGPDSSSASMAQMEAARMEAARRSDE